MRRWIAAVAALGVVAVGGWTLRAGADTSGMTPTAVSQPVVGAGSGAQPGQWQQESLGGMTYFVLLPSGYTAGKKYPVLLWLHQLQNDSMVPQQPGQWVNTADYRSRYQNVV